MHRLRFLLPLLMIPAGDGGAGGGGAEMMEVDLPGGIKISIPKDQAAKVIAGRDADKASARAQSEELGRLKAVSEAETAKATKAEQDKQALELAKKGEIDQVRELLTKQNTETVEKLAGKYRDVHLRSLIAQADGLLKLPDAAKQASLVDDLLAQLRPSCRFDLNADSLCVLGQDGRPALGSDGKPKTADAFLKEFLDARPYLRQPTQSPGSGGAGGGAGPATPGSITLAEYDAACKDPGRAQATAQAIAAGKLRVVG